MSEADLDETIAELRQRLERLYESGCGFQESRIQALSRLMDRLVLERMRHYTSSQRPSGPAVGSRRTE